MNTDRVHEYFNDFLYVIIRPRGSTDDEWLLYCSGVNIDRFLPITRGRHRPMSNPAIRGLQLVNLEVRSLALSRGATPRTVRGNLCAGVTPRKDSWSVEGMLIKNAPESLPDEIITYVVVNLMKKIDRAVMLGASMPEDFLEPHRLQLFIEDLCRKFGR